MKTKTSDRLLWIAVIIVAIALVLQALALKSIANTALVGAEYTRTDPIDLENAVKVPNEVLDAKYSKYKHVSEDGKILFLFTQEQVDAFLEMRKNGVRENLTLDEILYIIEDSIDVYFTYDSVVFTGLEADNSHISSTISSTDRLTVAVSFPKHPENIATYEIYYNHIVSSIMRIIWYRLSIHDSGFLEVYDGGLFESDDSAGIESGKIKFNDRVKDYEGYRHRCYYTSLSFDSTSVDDAYRAWLATWFYDYWVYMRDNVIDEKWHDDRSSIQNFALVMPLGRSELIMIDTDTFVPVKIFPTSSLDKRVRENVGYEWDTTD